MKLDILAIAAHPDDVELSCAGTMIKHALDGKKTGILDLTKGELGTRGTAEIRAQEAANASKIMMVAARENLDLGDGQFKNTHENQLKVISVIRKYQPDVILAPAIYDRHPDHGRGAQLSYDAWFYSGLTNFKTFDEEGNPQERWRPRLLLNYIQDRWIEPDIVVDISDVFETKMKAIRAFTTQFHDPNSKEMQTYLSSPEFLETMATRAREMGRPCLFKYAEGFTANNKFLGVKSVFDLY